VKKVNVPSSLDFDVCMVHLLNFFSLEIAGGGHRGHCFIIIREM